MGSEPIFSKDVGHLKSRTLKAIIVGSAMAGAREDSRNWDFSKAGKYGDHEFTACVHLELWSPAVVVLSCFGAIFANCALRLSLVPTCDVGLNSLRKSEPIGSERACAVNITMRMFNACDDLHEACQYCENQFAMQLRLALDTLDVISTCVLHLVSLMCRQSLLS